MQVLLIKTRSGRKWTIPKGIIDDGLKGPESAIKEAFEEAGLIGNINETVSWKFRFRKWGGIAHVTLYPMYVEKELEEYPENKIRAKKWVSVKEAVKMVKFDEVKKHILELENLYHDMYKNL